MTLGERIRCFVELGHLINQPEWRSAVLPRAAAHNGWFTARQTSNALDALTGWLTQQALNKWVSRYPLENLQPKTIGVVMAGNIPAVGFHDFLSVLISGHRLLAKTSSQDNVLIPSMARELIRMDARWESIIRFEERIGSCDAVIATGSNNSARYFEYYFRDRPLLLRKSRSSMAVLDGTESPDELSALGADIFSYYGLGCRSVSRILLPATFELDRLIGPLLPFEWVMENHKYANAYTYQRALLMMDQQLFTDNGFCVFRESDALASPVSVLHIGRYRDALHLQELKDSVRNDLQCIVGHGYTSFGQSQYPALDDYADGTDTMSFLIGV